MKPSNNEIAFKEMIDVLTQGKIQQGSTSMTFTVEEVARKILDAYDNGYDKAYEDCYTEIRGGKL